MRWAGFVLAGGNSTRMGQDKAELSFRGMPLGLWVARQVEQAAGNVTLVGGGHRDWGIPMLCDPEPGLGPLAGVVAALRASQADWNLIAACDLPGVTAGLLAKLVACAEERGKMALVPIHRNGNREPLCAAYHRGVLPFAESALVKHELSMNKLLEKIELELWPIGEEEGFVNTNTPEDWVMAGGKLA